MSDYRNGNLICAIDTETTGLEPGTHDIIQICVLPLKLDFTPDNVNPPFYMDLQPKRPDNWDAKAASVTKVRLSESISRGQEPYRAADLFDEWFERLRLAPEKRIIPLAQNWNFDFGFLIDWLGWKSVDRYFDSRYRDLMPAISFMNDRAAFRFDPPAIQGSMSLKALCGKFGISYEGAHDALTDCMLTAEVYREILKKHN